MARRQGTQIQQELKNLFETLRDIGFPKHTGNSEIDDLLDSIIELDAFYAGWALTMAEGGSINNMIFHDLKPVEQRCLSIVPEGSQEQTTLSRCKARLEIIMRIDSLLKGLFYGVHCKKKKEASN